MDELGGPGQDGPVVVVTTMPLSQDARADLSELLGPGFVVVDIKQAPTSANIVLTTVVSELTLGSLRGQFPQARILLTELFDDARDISYPGPLTRALRSGPDGYFFARGIESLPPIVESEARLQLTGSTRPSLPMLAAGTPRDRDDGRVLWLEAVADVSLDEDPLDLRPIDAAVGALLRTSEPRKTSLWVTMVAETAVYLAQQRRRTVVVDVSDLPQETRSQLRVRASRVG